MKKTKGRASQGRLGGSKSEVQMKQDIYVPPMDVLVMKVFGLQLTDTTQKNFAIKATFFDQIIFAGIVKTTSMRDPVQSKTLVEGTMNFDPSDYEKICLLADCPLIIQIQPLKHTLDTDVSTQVLPPTSALSPKSSVSLNSITDISCCNIDIMPLFLGTDKMDITKRMEPMLKHSLLKTKSWDNLPCLTLELSVVRNVLNERHHELLRAANYMKVTLVGAYNLLIPFEDEFITTAASKSPLYNETYTGLITFNHGHRVPYRFDSLSFYPKWEYLRHDDDIFTKGDEKFVCDITNIQNNENIDLDYYMSKHQCHNAIVWGSFHRTLMLGTSEDWLVKHLRQYSWPFEVHMNGGQSGLSFMAFLNLFHLLFPGENVARVAVPLYWVNAQTMREKCGCNLLLTPNDNILSTSASTSKPKLTADSTATSVSTVVGSVIKPTGSDGNSSFIVVEIKLAKALKEIIMPPIITSLEMKEMLNELEQGLFKRECTGRGQLDRTWQSTVRAAENALRKVPHYGMTEFCAFNRQLSETRTRVELITSFWLDAAVYVNNTFVVQEFLCSEKKFEEMLMISHACLMRMACTTLLGGDNRQDVDPTLRAARHARQMQDIPHATELYLQLVSQKPRGANGWRELSTCLQDVDRDWANVCLNKSIVLDPRQPLTLLCKGCMVSENDLDAAEPFFHAILVLYPFWSTGWVAVSAYFWKRELYHMAEQVMQYLRKSQAEGLIEDIGMPRAWEYELGDWWDHTPLLPGMSLYYNTADLLLRIRAMPLAEVCLSRAIAESGETAAWYHLVALSCRLRGDVDDALCHLQQGIEKFGDVNYLRGLQAECFHVKEDSASAMASYEKAGTCLGGYSILLSMPSWEAQRARSILLDLIRRQPSAYAWVSLAHDWMQRITTDACEGGDAGQSEEQIAAKLCAAACAVQALKWDRQAGNAWALLSRLVVTSARRLHCREMAKWCGYMFTDEIIEYSTESQQTLCHRLGRALRECRCILCTNLKF